MQHLSDIQIAMARGTMSDLREAFLAVAIEGWGSIVTDKGNEVSDGGKRKLLRQICELLRDDCNILPSDACCALDLLPGNTFASGAARALTLSGEPV